MSGERWWERDGQKGDEARDLRAEKVLRAYRKSQTMVRPSGPVVAKMCCTLWFQATAATSCGGWTLAPGVRCWVGLLRSQMKTSASEAPEASRLFWNGLMSSALTGPECCGERAGKGVQVSLLVKQETRIGWGFCHRSDKPGWSGPERGWDRFWMGRGRQCIKRKSCWME